MYFNKSAYTLQVTKTDQWANRGAHWLLVNAYVSVP